MFHSPSDGGGDSQASYPPAFASSHSASMGQEVADATYEPIVRAACEIIPFESLRDVVPGQGLCAASQELPVSLARDGALSDMRSALADLTVEFSLPLLSLEIIRDFWQILSLVLSFTFTAPFSVTIFFGNFAFILSLDFFLIVPVDLSVSLQAAYRAVWWILVVLVILLTAYMEWVVASVKLHPRREFGMFRTWSNIDKWTTYKIRALNFILTLMYLPVSQTSLELLFCSHRYRDRFGTCPDVPYYVFAAIMLAVMTIFLPIRFAQLISANAPKQRAYDSLGQVQRVRSDAEYKADIASISRTNPMAALFCEYRRPMRFHKVTTMLLKFYLIAVAVCLSGNQATGFLYDTDGRVRAETPSTALNHVRPALLISGLVVYTVLCLARKPFLASLANTLDVTLRVLAVLAVVCAWLIMFNQAKDAFAIILIVILSLTMLASLVFFISSFDLVQEKFRIWMGDVVLAETSADDPSPMWFNPDRIDLVRERKSRVWQHFWNLLLLHTDPFKYRESAHRSTGVVVAVREEVLSDVSDTGVKDSNVTAFEYVDSDDTVAYLIDFKGSVAERHHENVEIARDIGDSGYRLSLRGMTDNHAIANITALRVLHGLDVWWGESLMGVDAAATGASITKFNAGNGGFGAFFVLPVPVEGFWFPDDDGPEVRLSSEMITKLVATNLEPEVRRRRQVRQWLRALADASASGHDVEFPHTVEQSVEVIRDGQKLNVVSTTVYSRGKLHIQHRYDTPVFAVPDPASSRRPPLRAQGRRECRITPGFVVTLKYAEGVVTTAGHEHPSQWAPSLTLSAEQLGIMPSFQLTPKLQTLLNGNARLIEQFLPQTLQEADCFRRYFMSEFLAKQMTLSYAFWPTVVNNDRQSLSDVQAALRGERNPLLQSLASPAHEGLLKTLFARVAYFNSCPAVAIWVCFWHDVYYQNLDMSFISENEDVNILLNPWTPRGLSWNVMSQTRVTELLVGAGLQKDDGGGFIPSKVIGSLYAAMAKSMENFTAAGYSSVMRDSAADTVVTGTLFELERHEAYGPALAPFVDMTAAASSSSTHPLAAYAGLPTDTYDCYALDPAHHALGHYQRYLIVAQVYGGVTPEDVYDPAVAV